MTKSEIKNQVMLPILEAGFNVYFVGGCVRDKLTGYTPHDYDLVTDATPTQLHSIFSKFSEINSEEFGVIMPIINGELFEIATMRKDITKGRHPEVIFTTNIVEDSSRRDFTINALYEDINDIIIDPTGLGINDCENKCLRFVGDTRDRLIEDPLRAYRFVRFLSEKDLQSSEELNIELDFSEVSSERKLQELKKIISGKNFMNKNVQEYLKTTGIYNDLGITKLFSDLSSCKQNPKFHQEGNVLNHTLLVMKAMSMQEHDWIDMLAAMLHDVGKPIVAKELGNKEGNNFPMVFNHETRGEPLAREFCKNLKLSNKETDTICWLVKNHMQIYHFNERKSKFKIWVIVSNKNWDRLVRLCEADEKGSICNEPNLFKSVSNNVSTELAKSVIGKQMPRNVLTGDYLISKGESPSSAFKKMISRAYEEQINSNITNPEILYKKFKNILH